MTKVSQLVILFVVVVICFISYVYCDDFHVVNRSNVIHVVPDLRPKFLNRSKNAVNKEGGNITYTAEDVVTDEDGMYLVVINGDHEDDVCEVLLKESPRSIVTVVPTRNQGRVAITIDNGGIDSPIRFMNSLAFSRKYLSPIALKSSLI
ncbi:hypothetical protein MKW92_019245 [Papaver armeniacum]|nr:hypothetical protein MKW92_019245 [Papaver armeniacum]